MMLAVGRIVRAHGVRGEVLVVVQTDDRDRRFAAGTVLATDPAERGPLTVGRSRMQSGRLVVSFDGVTDRAAADALRGTQLLVDSADLEPIEDPDEFHDVDLLGLRACTGEGAELGVLEDVVHGPGGDLLVIKTADGREVLVPFVRDIVPTVDVPGGRIVLAPPEGLFEL